MVEIKVLKIKENAKVPQIAHEGDAGFDVHSTERYVLKPGERAAISSGIKLEIPFGYECQVRPRSGLALKHGISVINTPGTIDATYRGEVNIILINHGNEDYIVNEGDKVAQLIFKKLEEVNLKEVKEINQTKRGEGGFGSTGK